MVARAQSDDEISPDDEDYMMDEDDTLADLLADQITHEAYQLPRGSPDYPKHYFRSDHY